MTDKIKDFLILHLANTGDPVTDREVSEFIIDLHSQKDLMSQKLLICLGIDCANSIKIHSANYTANAYLQKIRSILLDAANCNVKLASFPGNITARWKFVLVQQKKKLEDLAPCFLSPNNINYTRLSTFEKYLQYVLDPNKQYNTGYIPFDGTPEELDFRYQQFLNGKFNNCNVTKFGFRYVFVADTSEIEQIKHDLGLTANSLGLYIQDAGAGISFVCINYNSGFKGETWHPDSLTGDWGNEKGGTGNEFYLSYKLLDNFGRTQSIDGKGQQLKERVHLQFDHAGTHLVNLNVANLGVLSKGITRCNDNDILIEGVTRFDEAI